MCPKLPKLIRREREDVEYKSNRRDVEELTARNASNVHGHHAALVLHNRQGWQERSKERVPVVEVEAHQSLIPFCNEAKETPPPISVWAKVNDGVLNINPIQLVFIWSMQQNWDKQ